MTLSSAFIADLILLVHALVVFFLVGSLPVIWLGYFRDWKFVRNFAFRISHVLLMAFVAAEALVGFVCPLTTWENDWLVKAGETPRYERGYIAHWVHRLVFYDVDERVFTLAYVLYLALVVLTFIWVRPRRTGKTQVVKESPERR
jgi:hypothetical protein